MQARDTGSTPLASAYAVTCIGCGPTIRCGVCTARSPQLGQHLPKYLPVIDRITLPLLATAPFRTIPGGLPRQLPGVPLVPTVDPQLLVDTRAVLNAVIPAIAQAQSVVDVALFSLQPDGAGLELAHALIAKAQQGVEVNVVLDARGSLQLPGTPWAGLVKQMRAAGVNVKITSPLAGGTANRFIDHRKMIVIDGKQAFVGGMNFAAMCDDWHDTMAHVGGATAAAAGAYFLQRWSSLGGAVSAAHHAATNVPMSRSGRAGAPADTGVLVNAPDRKEWALTEHYLHSIRTARKRLWIVTPFIGDQRIVRALQAAARRGVDVRVMTSGKPLMSQQIVSMFTRSSYDELLASGVKVGEIPQVTHAKILLVDDTATISSLNASRRATQHDHEMGIVSHNPVFRAQVVALMNADFARSKHYTVRDLNTIPQRVVNGIVSLFDIEY